MQQMTRILVVLDGTDADALIVAKAAALAHQHGAALELFICDAQRAYLLQRAYDQAGTDESRHRCVREWRRYLECLRDTMVGADVPIAIDVACESPLYEGIVRKVLNSHCDLVVKNASPAHPLRRFAWEANDWQLMRSCPAALLLSRGKPWQPCPRLAAAVDVSEEELLELPDAIVRASALLAKGFRGDLDILYSERPDIEARKHDLHVKALEALSRAAGANPPAIHILSGSAEEMLPSFVSRCGYDVLVMGALTHRNGISPLVGTLTAKLVETLDCDFVLVKPEAWRTQVEAALACAATEEPERKQTMPDPCCVRDPGFVSAWQLRAH